MKGLPGPVEVYELTGAIPGRSRVQAAAARGLTRFVGREGELEQLAQALDRARGGHGQVVAVVGEPGVGKTRLYREFSRSDRFRGWSILEADPVSYGQATSYGPVIELLRAYFRIESSDDPSRIREKVTSQLVSLEPRLAPSVPPILSLLDVAIEDEQWDRLDPSQRRSRTLDALRRLLLQESRVRPLVVVFENLHWIDPATQALLDSLVESLPTARLLLLVSYRPEYTHGWGSKTYYRQLQLDPLPPGNAEALLEALLGSDVSLAPLERLLLERTEGNPFLLEECVRTLVETGALVGARGAYRLVRPIELVQVPATVRAVLAARIDRLPPDDKRLLQSASVVGKHVPFALLHAVAEGSEDALRAGLGRLQATEFLYETLLFPDLEYTFKHALTHEVAYGTLLHDRRRTLHARIAAAIESAHADRLPEQIERLAHHAFHGEVWDKAVSYLRQAGAKAAGRSAYREARTCFEQALVALEHLPQTPDTLAQAIDLRFDLRSGAPADRRRREYLRASPGGRAPGRDARGFRAPGLGLRPAEPECLGEGPARRGVHVRAPGPRASPSRSARFTSKPWRTSTSASPAWPRVSTTRPRSSFGGPSRCWLAIGGASEWPRPGSRQCCRRSYLVMALAERGLFEEGIVASGRTPSRLAEALDHPFSVIQALRGLGYLYDIKGRLGRRRPPARARRGPVPRVEYHAEPGHPDDHAGSHVRAGGAGGRRRVPAGAGARHHRVAGSHFAHLACGPPSGRGTASRGPERRGAGAGRAGPGVDPRVRGARVRGLGAPPPGRACLAS